MTHTPTPWDLSCHTYDGQQLIDIGTKTTTVAIITESEETWLEDRANAGFIIRAVNMHDELVKALEKAQCDLELSHMREADDEVRVELGKTIIKVREAIKKARGGLQCLSV